MPKSVLITLKVAIDIPEGAELCDGYIHLPSGEAMLPVLAFEDHQNSSSLNWTSITNESEIEATIGGMEYVDCTISPMTDADLPLFN